MSGSNCNIFKQILLTFLILVFTKGIFILQLLKLNMELPTFNIGIWETTSVILLVVGLILMIDGLVDMLLLPSFRLLVVSFTAVANY